MNVASIGEFFIEKSIEQGSLAAGITLVVMSSHKLHLMRLDRLGEWWSFVGSQLGQNPVMDRGVSLIATLWTR